MTDSPEAGGGGEGVEELVAQLKKVDRNAWFEVAKMLAVAMVAAEQSAREARMALEPFAKAGVWIKEGRGVWVERPFDGQIGKADFERAAEVYGRAKAEEP